MKRQSFSSLSDSLRSVLLVGLIVVLFVSQYQIPAAMQSRDEAIETRLTELFDLCRRDDLEIAAAYFVYRGADKSREWKDIFHTTDPAERSAVASLCHRIKGYLDESEGYQFGEVKVEKESEGEWHVLEVSFQQEGDKTKKALFAFLLINGQYAVGDID